MKALNLSSSNLTLVGNATINFTGLCTPNNFDIATDRTFSEEVRNDFILLPVDKLPIQEINAVDVKSTILNYKVIETPGNTSSAFVSNYGEKRLTGKKMSVFGVVCLDITYTSTDTTAVNQKFQGKVPFTSYIVLPKTTLLSATFDVSCCIQNITFISIENSNINISVSFTVSAKKNSSPVVIPLNNCTCAMSTPLTTTGITSGTLLKNLISRNDKVWNEISFSRNLILPSNLPNAKNVTAISSSIKLTSQKIIQTPESQPNAKNFYGESLSGKKLIIEAVLKQRITYVADNQENTTHSLIINLPFSCYIIVPKANELNQKFNVNSYIEDLHSCCINERTLFTGAILFFMATQENCTSISKNACCKNACCKFDTQYNLEGVCNIASIPPLINRSTWSELTFYRRIDLSINSPVNFIKSISTSLKIISTNLVETPKTNGNQLSIEGFLLSGITCVVNGYLKTNITYNSSNSSGSVTNIEMLIPFSGFIVLVEQPTNLTKLVVTPCIENVFATVLDKAGIGISSQVFLQAKIVPKTV